ncbi:hypothetical protein IAQ61_006519 [Plenodomus lingam]|uniref:uncharacterized protein n=1 Tax=Leptosphaeria maculans TaxID=5022 RepID=UPI00332EC69B|nr:hypothetical protein IAQ61_006519 [Plenodomus lingam]
MKPEALDAMATQTMRPEALDAATAPDAEKGQPPSDKTKSATPKKSPVPTTRPGSPPSDEADNTHSVGQVVEKVVHEVKAVIDGVLSWAEDKADGLSAKQDDTGPYSSPALCAPSDMDPIASGILPAMPSEDAREHDRETRQDEKSSKVVSEDNRERKKE